MESQNAFARKAHRWRMTCWIIIGVSLVAMAWGLKLLIAHGGVKGGSPAAAFAVVFGFLGLVIAVITLFTVRSQGRSYDTITSSDHPVLLRWQCTEDEARRFIAAEAIRLRVSRMATFYFILILIPFGFLIAYAQRDNFDWGSFLGMYAVTAACLSFFYISWRVSSRAEFRTAKTRATSEVVIDAEGLVTGTDVYRWRSLGWGLEEATYENGQPDVLNLVFVAGDAAVGTLRTAAYAAGAVSSPGGTTQTHVTLRIPVTASKADEVRHLLSTTISKHLLTPSVIS